MTDVVRRIDRVVEILGPGRIIGEVSPRPPARPAPPPQSLQRLARAAFCRAVACLIGKEGCWRPTLFQASQTWQARDPQTCPKGAAAAIPRNVLFTQPCAPQLPPHQVVMEDTAPPCKYSARARTAVSALKLTQVR